MAHRAQESLGQNNMAGIRLRDLNGAGKAVIGTVLAALITLFAFINGIPWEAKGTVAVLKSDLQRELGQLRDEQRELREDVREILRFIRR